MSLHSLRRYLHLSLRKTVIWAAIATSLTMFLLSLAVTFSSVQAASSTLTYSDRKLGFSIQVPAHWTAYPHPGSSAIATTSSVTFTSTPRFDSQIEISVIRSATNAYDFAQKRQPTIHIGNYPAFNLDTPAQKQFPVPCLIRTFLAGTDRVIANWCAPDARAHTQQFEQILSTYQPHGIKQNQISMAPLNVRNPESCASLAAQASSVPTTIGDWGQQQGNPTDAQWTANFNPGASVCSNFVSPGSSGWGGYDFQCVEIANRFISEQWGLASFTLSAEYYYDYYSGRVRYDGQARTLFGNNVQLSDDATQGTSAFAPVPGDLLIWQAVADASRGWTSGLQPGGTGHVAVITNVDATHVYIAQQNYDYNDYYKVLSLTKVANGWKISGLSVDSNTIVRGWIHFTVNPHHIGTISSAPVSFTYAAPGYDGHLEVFSRGGNNNIWHAGQTAPNSTSWNSNSAIIAGYSFNGDPAVGLYQGALQIFARGSDNNIWHLWQVAPNGAWSSQWQPLQTGYAFQGIPAVINDANGNIEVFARGSDNHLWHNVYANGWGGWMVLGSASFNSDPAVGLYQGAIQVFARGTDNNIWHFWQVSANGAWTSQWQPLQTGYTFRGTPAVANDANGNIEVFARGSDNHLWHNVYANGWSGWMVLGSTSFNGDPAVGLYQGALQIFARGSDNNIWHLWQVAPNGAWTSQWQSLQTGYAFQGTPAVANDANGNIEVFARGSDNNIWHNVYASGWSGWMALY